MFLSIFKTYKVVRSLASAYGETFIEWHVRNTVQVSFASEKIQALDVLAFLRLDNVVAEMVKHV